MVAAFITLGALWLFAEVMGLVLKRKRLLKVQQPEPAPKGPEKYCAKCGMDLETPLWKQQSQTMEFLRQQTQQSAQWEWMQRDLERTLGFANRALSGQGDRRIK